MKFHALCAMMTALTWGVTAMSSNTRGVRGQHHASLLRDFHKHLDPVPGEDPEESALLQNASADLRDKSNATRNSCETCQGWACCCETTCGQVGSTHVAYDVFSGTFYGGIVNNGYGAAVTYVENAADQCSEVLQPNFPASPNVITTDKPCCLYTGQAGFDWGATEKSCNVLEQVPAVADLLEEPATKGSPHIVKKCSNVPFPTNFWETLSKQWAIYMNSNKNCHGKIFVLIPDVTSYTDEELEKKISIRVELGALKANTNVNIITNNNCRDLHKRVCGTSEIRLVLEDKKVYCVEVPDVATFKTINPATFTPTSSSFTNEKIDCHFFDGFFGAS